MKIQYFRKKRSRKKFTLKPYLIAFASIFALVLVFFLFSRLEHHLEETPEGAGTAPTWDARTQEEGGMNVITIGGKDYYRNPNLSVLLIIGVDDYGITRSESSRNTSQADFITLALFDHSDSTVRLLQLNRDTMTNVPVLDSAGNVFGLTYQQLCLAHTYGSGLADSCENTEYAVSLLLYSIPIDNYFAVTMDVIPILNDLVGGVTVTIEDDFTGVDSSLVQGSTMTLNGTQAESFVRARRAMQDDPTNIARMRRQRVYISALTEALKKSAAENSSFVMDAYAAIKDYLVTDCTVDELYDYADELSDYSLTEIITPEGKSVAGEDYMEFYVDDQSLRELVIELFYLPVEEG